ncbi:hypothetical protein GCM10009551_073460 [Nocardiopsis tropica]|uniref:hypothetical protein n=1 Tax=Tsukamurella strandjordii TaxID=147577 RepID=UPI0031DF7CBF
MPPDRQEQRNWTHFGYGLALFILLDVAALLWAGTFPGDPGLGVLSFLGGVVLLVAWLVYLAAWTRTIRRFAWQLLIIPLIGAIAIGLGVTNAVPQARWNYDEPRLRTAAERMLADPRVDLNDYEERTIGTQHVYSANKTGGVVRFHIAGPSISTTSLAYHPEGVTPTNPTRTRVRHIDGRWWLELSD